MKIGGLQKVSLLDFPGRLSAVIFVKGCNWRCPFCFNRDLVLDRLPTISQRTVLAFLRQRQRFLDGVVVTGGEPLLQPDLADFIRKIRRLGYLIKLDTNGSQPVALEKLLNAKLLDYIALDIKAPLDARYAKVIGTADYDPQPVLDTIRLLCRSRLPLEFRTTTVPGLHDRDTLRLMARQLRRLTGRRRVPWFWQNFQPKNCLDSKFNQRQPHTQPTLNRFLAAAQRLYPQTSLRAG